MHVWGRIGNISHGFLALKYDTRGDKPELNQKSILSYYGFQPVVESMVNNTAYRALLGKLQTQYGKRFILGPQQLENMQNRITRSGLSLAPNLAEDTYILLGQPFLAITNRRYGTLLIRNSSPNPRAGRNLRNKEGHLIMPHPAYWSPKYVGSDIMILDPQVYLDPTHYMQFQHVLDPKLYLNRSSDNAISEAFEEKYHGNPLPMDAIQFLTEQLDEWRSHYRLWKFNTTAPNNQQLAPGFVPFCKSTLFLSQNQLAKTGSPLAFVLTSHRYPAFLKFPWTDSKKSEQWQYLLDAPHRKEIDAYLNGDTRRYSPEHYKNMDLFHFFQAAVYNRADIVLADPSKGSIGAYTDENS